jgi:hypothetical protein
MLLDREQVNVALGRMPFIKGRVNYRHFRASPLNLGRVAELLSIFDEGFHRRVVKYCDDRVARAMA